MAVNALVTGLIIYKILKVFLEVKGARNLVEKTLGSTGGSTKLQHIVFVVVESGMALFAIQLIRIVFYILPVESGHDIIDYVIVLDRMFNVIIRSVHLYFFFFFL